MRQFQHTAARRRLHPGDSNSYYRVMVSTHSRAEAVALFDRTFHESQQCFNTQPPEGGCAHYVLQKAGFTPVSTHSRPKAAAQLQSIHDDIIKRFNTQPPEGGCRRQIKSLPYRNLFQHTAARRRLLITIFLIYFLTCVSTHSRAEAAAWHCNSKRRV